MVKVWRQLNKNHLLYGQNGEYFQDLALTLALNYMTAAPITSEQQALGTLHLLSEHNKSQNNSQQLQTILL